MQAARLWNCRTDVAARWLVSARYGLHCTAFANPMRLTRVGVVFTSRSVHDEQCRWHTGIPPNPRHPEWGSGFLSENLQDSQRGDDHGLTCEHLVLNGDDDGNSYTCERDFCETCGENAGLCDAFCGNCRSIADPIKGDFPGSTCRSTRCFSALIGLRRRDCRSLQNCREHLSIGEHCDGQ